MYRKCISVHLFLEASALCACLPYICCFLTVAVRRREWRWKAAIFIQCLCEPDAADWLNACHIDTPVVSPVGPQRHNGVGIGGASVCPWPLDSATRRLGRIVDAFVCQAAKICHQTTTQEPCFWQNIQCNSWAGPTLMLLRNICQSNATRLLIRRPLRYSLAKNKLLTRQLWCTLNCLVLWTQPWHHTSKTTCFISSTVILLWSPWPKHAAVGLDFFYFCETLRWCVKTCHQSLFVLHVTSEWVKSLFWANCPFTQVY